MKRLSLRLINMKTVPMMPAPDNHCIFHICPSPTSLAMCPSLLVHWALNKTESGISRRRSRGVSDTGQLWLFPLAAVPAW